LTRVHAEIMRPDVGGGLLSSNAAPDRCRALVAICVWRWRRWVACGSRQPDQRGWAGQRRRVRQQQLRNLQHTTDGMSCARWYLRRRSLPVRVCRRRTLRRRQRMHGGRYVLGGRMHGYAARLRSAAGKRLHQWLAAQGVRSDRRVHWRPVRVRIARDHVRQRRMCQRRVCHRSLRERYLQLAAEWMLRVAGHVSERIVHVSVRKRRELQRQQRVYVERLVSERRVHRRADELQHASGKCL